MQMLRHRFSQRRRRWVDYVPKPALALVHKSIQPEVLERCFSCNIFDCISFRNAGTGKSMLKGFQSILGRKLITHIRHVRIDVICERMRAVPFYTSNPKCWTMRFHNDIIFELGPIVKISHVSGATGWGDNMSYDNAERCVCGLEGSLERRVRSHEGYDGVLLLRFVELCFAAVGRVTEEAECEACGRTKLVVIGTREALFSEALAM